MSKKLREVKIEEMENLTSNPTGTSNITWKVYDSMPKRSQSDLLSHLNNENGESLEMLARPNFFLSRLWILFFLIMGSIAVIVLSIVLDLSKSLLKGKHEALLFLIYFPVVGIFLLFSWLIWRKKYVALTQEKIIINLGFGPSNIIAFGEISKMYLETTGFICAFSKNLVIISDKGEKIRVVGLRHGQLIIDHINEHLKFNN
eukprot:TRINITY_DN9392_c0_g1_i1.p1 TRINITY_DN9392_c0_g1~~TRINITY_DN9392_c0_g1_i1.p1  ORF type:complete len:202 (-),score=19.45 TRINITY_DN9392_c0_g1_i1:248-853(-)